MQSLKRIKHVTNKQGVKLAQFARDHKVSRTRFKEFLDNEEKVKEFLNQFKLRNLEHLQSEKIISISAMTFKPNEFFIHRREDDGIQLWLSENMKNEFLPLLSGEIDFDGLDLEKLRLKKDLNDFEIQAEIGNQIQSPDAIAAEIKYLVSQQPKGEKTGDLDIPYVSHVFYFKHKGRVWYVFLVWNSDDCEWNLDCSEAAGSWSVGKAVFSPATDKSLNSVF